MDSAGNVWVGLHGAGKLMKIDYKTTQMTIYSPPTEDSGVYSVQGDPKSDLVWFSEQHVDKMARFDPKTEKFTEFPLASAESDPRGWKSIRTIRTASGGRETCRDGWATLNS